MTCLQTENFNVKLSHHINEYWAVRFGPEIISIFLFPLAPYYLQLIQ